MYKISNIKISQSCINIIIQQLALVLLQFLRSIDTLIAMTDSIKQFLLSWCQSTLLKSILQSVKMIRNIQILKGVCEYVLLYREVIFFCRRLTYARFLKTKNLERKKTKIMHIFYMIYQVNFTRDKGLSMFNSIGVLY